MKKQNIEDEYLKALNHVVLFFVAMFILMFILFLLK